MPSLDLLTHVAEPGSINSKRITAKQHEKASLVCVRVQSPSGLALVPCELSMVDLSGQLRCRITHTYLNHTHKHPWYRIMFVFLATYARTTRYEEAFFSLENQRKIGPLRSRASLQIAFPYYVKKKN